MQLVVGGMDIHSIRFTSKYCGIKCSFEVIRNLFNTVFVSKKYEKYSVTL